MSEAVVEAYKVLGYEEAVTTCDCCGRANLKGTFAVERDDGELLHFGCVCVTRHTGKPAKTIKKEAKAAEMARVRSAAEALRLHPAVIAENAKVAHLFLLGTLPGKHFRDAHREERSAADAARQEIAAKYGLKGYEICL